MRPATNSSAAAVCTPRPSEPAATMLTGLPSLAPFAFFAASAALVRSGISRRSFSARRLGADANLDLGLRAYHQGDGATVHPSPNALRRGRPARGIDRAVVNRADDIAKFRTRQLAHGPSRICRADAWVDQGRPCTYSRKSPPSSIWMRKSPSRPEMKRRCLICKAPSTVRRLVWRNLEAQAFQAGSISRISGRGCWLRPGSYRRSSIARVRRNAVTTSCAPGQRLHCPLAGGAARPAKCLPKSTPAPTCGG
jgi:hypothetical protein